MARVKNLKSVLVDTTQETTIWDPTNAPDGIGAGTPTTISNITFANTTSSAINVSLFYHMTDTTSFATTGPHLLRRNLSVPANQNQIIDYGIALNNLDKLTVVASSAGLAVNVFGAADVGYSFSPRLMTKSNIGNTDEVQLIDTLFGSRESEHAFEDKIIRSIVIANTSGTVSDQINLAVGIPTVAAATIYPHLVLTDSGNLYGSSSNNLTNFEFIGTYNSTSFQLSQIKYIGNKWIMTGTGTQTSVNGSDWNAIGFDFRGVANNGTNVVGNPGFGEYHFFISSDLEVWDYSYLYDVSNFNGILSPHVGSVSSTFAAMAGLQYGPQFNAQVIGAVYSTNNGTSWVSRPLQNVYNNDVGTEFGWNGHITSIDGLLVAIMHRDYYLNNDFTSKRTTLQISTSTDGNNWTSRYNSGDVNYQDYDPILNEYLFGYNVAETDIATSGTKILFSAGPDRPLMYSANGTSWVTVSNNFVDYANFDYIRSIFADETGRFYVSTATGLYSSTNGTSWSLTHQQATLPFSSQDGFGVAQVYGFSQPLASAGGPVYDQAEYVLRNTTLAPNSTIVLGPEHGYAVGSFDNIRFKSNTGNSIATVFGAPIS